MSSIAFQTIEGRVAFVKEINFSQSLKLFLVLLRMYKKNFLLKTVLRNSLFFIRLIPKTVTDKRPDHRRGQQPVSGANANAARECFAMSCPLSEPSLLSSAAD